MRVLLVRPNSKWRSTYVPLGLGYIATSVREAGHQVSILDARFLRLSVEETVRKIQDEAPNVIGLTAVHMDYEIHATLSLLDALKVSNSSAAIVMGGPLASTMGYELADQGLIDAAIIGEGEKAFNAYLEFLDDNRRMDEIPGLVYRSDGGVRTNIPGMFLEELDRQFPAWDLINPKKYFSRFGRVGMSLIKKSGRSVPILTSRGCPFGCIYCHNIFGRKFRPRSSESVLSEILMLYERYGVREIEIVDDCFNLDIDRAKEIAQGIIDKNLNLFLCFPNGLRADRMDEELVDLLKEAGAYHIRYAVETASPRLQKLIHKNLDLEKTRRIIAYTAQKGISTLGFFMLGFPTETEKEMNATVQFALASKFHAAQFFYVTPFPGTELARKYLLTQPNNEGITRMGYYDLKVNLSEVPDETLRMIKKRAYRAFHFSPGRMWRAFRTTPKNLRTVWAVVVTAIFSVYDKKDW